MRFLTRNRPLQISKGLPGVSRRRKNRSFKAGGCPATCPFVISRASQSAIAAVRLDETIATYEQVKSLHFDDSEAHAFRALLAFCRNYPSACGIVGLGSAKLQRPAVAGPVDFQKHWSGLPLPIPESQPVEPISRGFPKKFVGILINDNTFTKQ